MKKVALSEILTSSVVAVTADAAITEVLSTMSLLRISCMIAVNSERHPLGIFTERDAVRLLAEHRDIASLRMCDVMSASPFCSKSDVDFRDAFRMLQERGFRHLIVVDANNCLVGIVSEGDFLRHLDADDLFEIKTVAKIMSGDVATVHVEATLADAIATMHRQQNSCVVVTHGLNPVGILTERDVVKLALTITDPGRVSVSSVMHAPLITIPASTTLPDAIAQLEAQKIRHLVVAEQGKLLGVLTRHSLVKTLQGNYVNFLSETVQEQRSELFQLSQKHTLFKLHDAALKASANAIIITDINAVIQWANPAFAKLTGYGLEEVIGKQMNELVRSGEQSSEFYEVLWQTILSGQMWRGELVNKRKNGTLYDQDITITPVRNEGNEITHFIAIKQDITERKQVEKQLREAAAVMENTHEGVMITDTDSNIIAVNSAYSAITGYSADEVIGKNPSMFIAGRADKLFYEKMWKNLQKNGLWQGEVWNRRKSGEVFPQLLTISTVYDDKHMPTRYVGVFADISQLKKHQEKLEFMAHHDHLTQLPNRSLVEIRLKQEVEQAHRHGHQVCVLFIDLDRFKLVNDSFGHMVGDELLCAVAQRLNARLRKGDTLGRLGGDEFILLASPLRDTQDAAVIARDFIAALSAPFMLSSGSEVFIGGSVGISIFPQDGETVSELMKNADAAMYLAKESGRNQFSFYSKELNSGARSRLAMENNLRRAVLQNELMLHYQPKVDLRTGKICGAEALARWQLADGSMVSPADFIPIAEKSNLILSLGNWVIEQACLQIRTWLDEGLQDIQIAINISARQFRSGNLDQVLTQALKTYKIDATYLELELTESMLMQEPEMAVATMHKLKQIGVKISLDDFGTGYSSLTYLSRFPIDTLKIDQSFVRNITTEPDAAEIAMAIIGLAHRMDLRVIAEGVETDAQLAYLRENGCDEIQGYYFSRPLAPQGFADILRSGKSLPRAAEKSGTAYTLLIVNDDPDKLTEIEHSLQGENCCVLTANNAHAGLELLALKQVQVVLVGQHQASMDGTEFLRTVGEIHPRTVRILLAENYDNLATVSQAINAGIAHKFLTKPISEEHLRKHILDAFAYHKAIFLD